MVIEVEFGDDEMKSRWRDVQIEREEQELKAQMKTFTVV